MPLQTGTRGPRFNLPAEMAKAKSGKPAGTSPTSRTKQPGPGSPPRGSDESSGSGIQARAVAEGLVSKDGTGPDGPGCAPSSRVQPQGGVMDSSFDELLAKVMAGWCTYCVCVAYLSA